MAFPVMTLLRILGRAIFFAYISSMRDMPFGGIMPPTIQNGKKKNPRMNITQCPRLIVLRPKKMSRKT